MIKCQLYKDARCLYWCILRQALPDGAPSHLKSKGADACDLPLGCRSVVTRTRTCGRLLRGSDGFRDTPAPVASCSAALRRTHRPQRMAAHPSEVHHGQINSQPERRGRIKQSDDAGSGFRMAHPRLGRLKRHRSGSGVLFRSSIARAEDGRSCSELDGIAERSA